MNLKVINQHIDKYCGNISSADDYDWTRWESINRFQDAWDLDVSDFKAMLESAFDKNDKLWSRPDYYPLQSMLRYIDINDEVVRSIFQDLYNEKREIVGRIDRFLYQCDDLRMNEKRNVLSAPSHYHADRSAIFGYLCYRYPELYALYNEASFLTFMTQVGAKDLDLLPDINRFLKVAKIVKTLLLKHPSFINLMTQIVIPEEYQNKAMLHVSAILNVVE